MAKPVTSSVSYDTIIAYIEEQMHRMKMPSVSLAIVEGDKILYMAGFGQALSFGEVPAHHTPFIIGSLSKSSSTLTVMQLVEAGQIELGASVQHNLPWVQMVDPQATVQITVCHIESRRYSHEQ